MHLIFFKQIHSNSAFKHKTNLFCFTWLVSKNKCSSALSNWGHKSFCKNEQQLAVEPCNLKKVLFQTLKKLSIIWLPSHQNGCGVVSVRTDLKKKIKSHHSFDCSSRAAISPVASCSNFGGESSTNCRSKKFEGRDRFFPSPSLPGLGFLLQLYQVWCVS